MFVIQYGMQGSASSWVPWSGLKDAPMSKLHPNPWDVLEGVKLLSPEEAFVLKTHSDPPTALIPALMSGEIRAIMTTRDPFDAAVSIYNKGIKARETGTKPFAHVETLAQALEIVRGDVLKASRWRACPGVLELSYKLVRYEPKVCARLCAQKMGYAGDMKKVNLLTADSMPNYGNGIEGKGMDSFTLNQITDFFVRS